MSPPTSPDSPNDGWWAIDVAAYLLTRLESLAASGSAAQLDPAEAIDWIRRNELGWAPGSFDLKAEVPWDDLRNAGSGEALVDVALDHAAKEVATAMEADGADDLCPFAARRFLPLGTLWAYGAPHALQQQTNAASADGHVHQGAALPIEVTLHWIAAGVTSIGGAPEGPPPMEDTTGTRFHPLPLLLLLRALTDESALAGEQEVLQLVTKSAKGDANAWNQLNARLAFAEGASRGVPRVADLVEAKKEARASGDSRRYTTLLRVEAILHAAVSQRESGLDVFVEQFERLAKLRRTHISREEKADYFRESIANHTKQSNHKLKRLELRLGELISGRGIQQAAVEKDFLVALKGYQKHIGGKPHPIAVTFPWGLVKSRPGTGPQSNHWRFNPAGIYELIEVLLEVISAHPPLADFVDGIDVCGLEEGEPNWLFAPAFKRFADRTSAMQPVPACRFHAGEWQWTPLHGLRRISEFLRFDLPPRTPRRIGHGLALHSNNWERIGRQPADELLDDLLWATERLNDIDGVSSALRRATARLVLDLREIVYADPKATAAGVDALVDAYAARFETDSLVQVSFIQEADDGRLFFDDRPVPARLEPRLQLLIAHLSTARPVSPSVAGLLDSADSPPGLSIHTLQATLAELYEMLAPEVIDDVRWNGVIVEACPSSNVIAGDVRGYARHPMAHLIDNGVLMTVNSDDPSIFHSWMPEELSHAEHRMKVGRRQVKSSRELGLRIVAPGLQGDVSSRLNSAITSLEGR